MVALGKLDTIKTGDTLSSGKTAPSALVEIAPSPPVLAMALAAADRKDDVKLGQALARLNEEDPSLHHRSQRANPRHRAVGAGRDASARRAGAAEGALRRQCQIAGAGIGYQETIRKSVTAQRGRHKKQSGGHGQFGDVVLDIKPMPRGGGFEFVDKIVGGAVPRNYIGAVEEGVVDAWCAVRSASPSSMFM